MPRPTSGRRVLAVPALLAIGLLLAAPSASGLSLRSTSPAAPIPRTTQRDHATPSRDLPGGEGQGAGAPRSFTLAVTGDLLPHLPVVARARADAAGTGRALDFAPMLAPLRPLIEPADLALCHLEVPLSADGRVSGYPAFNGPAELAAAIVETGYDGCSTASNHAVDRGFAGVAATLDVLDAVGLRHVGTARSPEEDVAPAWYDAGGVRVAQLSATYGLNGLPVPAQAPWSVDLIEPARILADAAAARAAGAEFVVISLHWGIEYQAEPTAQQRALAAQLLASPDVDLLVGHHAHVVQPVERIGGEVVVYGLGNLLSNQSAACCAAATQDGMVVTLTVAEPRRGAGLRVEEVSITPTYVERPTFRVLAVPQTLADPATPPGLRAQLEASAARTAAVAGSGTAAFGARRTAVVGSGTAGGAR